MSKTLGLLLLSGTQERAHYAFLLASGAAALGRRVTLFASNGGCRALLLDVSSLADIGREEILAARGVAGLQDLRAACLELGVRLLACEAGLRAEALEQAALLPEVTVAGVASFLEAVGDGQILTL